MAQPLFARVLLTNDDGIDAPGMEALEAIAAEIAAEVWVVAPARDQSGTGASVSLHDPLRFEQRGPRRFAVGGTPADCAAIGLRHVMAGSPPEILLSGVNRGSNVGADTIFSGTAGAALAAMSFGLPAIALSQAFTDGQEVPWSCVRALAPAAIARLVEIDPEFTWAARSCLNLNFPDCRPEAARPMVVTRQGRGCLGDIEVVARVDTRGHAYHWLKFRNVGAGDAAGTETAELAAGHVTLTPLGFDRTETALGENLRAALEDAGLLRAAD
jgi:5'-nucleotidase